MHIFVYIFKYLVVTGQGLILAFVSNFCNKIVVSLIYRAHVQLVLHMGLIDNIHEISKPLNIKLAISGSSCILMEIF